MKIGILGGGLTGLVVGSAVKHPYQIIEKEQECGGLCRTFMGDGYTWDYGGAHILFSQNQKVIDLEKKLLGKNLAYRRRNNKIYYEVTNSVSFKGRLVKYPFENGLGELAVQDNFECLYNYLFNEHQKKPTNLEEWFYYTFGKGIADKYLLPYNRKIWNMDLTKMGMEWVARIPKPPSEDIIKSSLGIPTEGYKHQLNFLYPVIGGAQTLTNAFRKINHGKISLETNVTGIFREKKQWKVITNKGYEHFDVLVSTIPLPEMTLMLKNVVVPVKVKKAAKSLRYNTEINVLLGLSTPKLNDITAIYIPDEDFLPNRVAFPPNFSPKTVPSGCFSVAAEIILKPNDTVLNWSKEKIYRHVISGLEKRNIIKKNSVVYKRMEVTKYAYVVYDKQYTKNMKILRDYFSRLGIFLCGRFGDFTYINTDVCIENGLKLAEELNKLRD